MTHEDVERRRARIAERLRDIQGVQAALKEAARRTIREQARAGRRIAVWRDGQVVWELPQLTEEDRQ